MKASVRRCRKLAMPTVLTALMLCQSIIRYLELLRGEGEAAYKSMSWSTSSRDRVKLGRLDSEPPLLLREWPPETGRRDKGRQGDKINTGKQREGRSRGAGVKTGKHSSRREERCR